MPVKASSVDSEEALSPDFSLQMSSPEDQELRSLKESLEQASSEAELSLGELPSLTNSIMGSTGSSSNSSVMLTSPLLTQGIFPYQAHPIAAVVSAGLTLAVMTLKETGKVDIDSILFLLNSSDLYAGILGSISGHSAQSGGQALVKALSRGLQKWSPETIAPILQKESVKMIGNIVNGFTYSFSVSAGFEVYSQFWKIATKNIPEADTIAKFVKAPTHIKKRVALNLLYYSVMDKNLQKQVIDSIYYHRIMTFEFIAMNVAMYVGAQLGALAAHRYAPENVWAKRLGPVVGSVALGTVVQFIPDSWKSGANAQLLDWKLHGLDLLVIRLRGVEEKIVDLETTIKTGIDTLSYPDTSVAGTMSYWSAGVDLESDLDRLTRKRDLLASLQMQKAFADPSQVALWTSIGESHLEVADFLENALAEVKKDEVELSTAIQTWMQQRKPAAQIQKLALNYYKANPRRVYYEILLDEAATRARESAEETMKFIQHLSASELQPQ